MNPTIPPPSHSRSFIFRCPLCDTIPNDKKDSFLDDVRFNMKNFNKNDTIILQGSQYDKLYILIKGEVQTEMVDEKGDFMHIAIIGAPNPLAIGFLFASNGESPVTAIAKEDCTLVVIPKDNVYFLMRKYEEFMMAFLKYISNKVSDLSERLRLVSLRTIKAKLAYYLLKESNGENVFDLKTSKEDIARLFGVSRPALVNVMMQMVEEKLITVDRRRIEIIDRGAIQRLL